LSGWLSGYLGGSDGIDEDHRLTILKQVREFQKGI